MEQQLEREDLEKTRVEVDGIGVAVEMVEECASLHFVDTAQRDAQQDAVECRELLFQVEMRSGQHQDREGQGEQQERYRTLSADVMFEDGASEGIAQREIEDEMDDAKQIEHTLVMEVDEYVGEEEEACGLPGIELDIEPLGGLAQQKKEGEDEKEGGQEPVGTQHVVIGIKEHVEIVVQAQADGADGILAHEGLGHEDEAADEEVGHEQSLCLTGEEGAAAPQAH